jgi:hypothetical protein
MSQSEGIHSVGQLNLRKSERIPVLQMRKTDLVDKLIEGGSLALVDYHYLWVRKILDDILQLLQTSRRRQKQGSTIPNLKFISNFEIF